MSQQIYDVVILGGGLAGLSLSIQLKKENPNLSILVLEKSSGAAPIATHKVGESISELGSYYLREVLCLKEHLEDAQLPKFGFRFFFSPEFNYDISRRVELGSRTEYRFPAHQIDRGVFENFLITKLSENGIEFIKGAKVINFEIKKENHIISFQKGAELREIDSKWTIDATGRNSFFKRKFNLQKDLQHNINAIWFRINHIIDIEDWSNDAEWILRVPHGHRRLATNHLMGEGYWVWIIPLIGGSTSIGIVADPRYHNLSELSSLDKALNWLSKYEPQAAKEIMPYIDKVLDFKQIKNFAYDTQLFISENKWAVTGEAGAFMDPLYSPGTDIIALCNTWITDVIVNDYSKSDIRMKINIYNHLFKELLSGWSRLYRDMYFLFGKTEIMMMKILWDWATYWSMPCVIFMNNGYCNPKVLTKLTSTSQNLGKRFSRLNEAMQKLFIRWAENSTSQFSDYYLNIFSIDILKKFQKDLGIQYSDEELLIKIEHNFSILEQIALEIIRLVNHKLLGTPINQYTNPYTIDQDQTNTTNKQSFECSVEPNPIIKEDVEKIWVDSIILMNPNP